MINGGFVLNGKMEMHTMLKLLIIIIAEDTLSKKIHKEVRQLAVAWELANKAYIFL